MHILVRAGFDFSGYTDFTCGILQSLLKLKDITFDVQATNLDQRIKIPGNICKVINPDNYDFCVDFSCVPSPFAMDGIFPKRKKIVFSMFETVNIPSNWFQFLEKYSAIICPSKYNADLLCQYIPSFVVPLGINPDEFLSNKKTVTYTNRPNYLFGFVGTWIGRKNTEGLIKTFLKTFSKEENVGLVLVTRPLAFQSYKIDIRDDCYFILDELVKTLDEVNRNIFIINYVKDMPAFLRSLDCYVTATYGEGWNLPLMQAMACGVPVIAPNYTSHTEFLNKCNSFLYEDAGTISVGSLSKSSFIVPDAEFYNPNLQQLSDLMRKLSKGKLDVTKKVQNALTVIDHFSYDVSAQKFVEVLKKCKSC